LEETQVSGDKDACEICKGERGGVPGNENVVEGVTMCDYCHAERMMDREEIEMKPLPEYGDHMTVEEWLAAVDSGCFIDYDGHGKWANATQMSNKMVVPSDVSRKCFEIPLGMTHVVWFNK
jgi:hypothetical protein